MQFVCFRLSLEHYSANFHIYTFYLVKMSCDPSMTLFHHPPLINLQHGRLAKNLFHHTVTFFPCILQKIALPNVTLMDQEVRIATLQVFNKTKFFISFFAWKGYTGWFLSKMYELENNVQNASEITYFSVFKMYIITSKLQICVTYIVYCLTNQD